MIELACDSETGGPCADYNGVGAVQGLCSHDLRSSSSVAGPSSNTIRNGSWFIQARRHAHLRTCRPVYSTTVDIASGDAYL
jgi:hypothetical protein